MKAAQAVHIQAHLKTCSCCRANLVRLQQLSGVVQQRFRQVEVPAHVERAARSATQGAAPRRRIWLGLALVASIGLVVLAGLSWPRRQLTTAVRDEIVARHLAGFARREPCDFESADAKAVGAWLTEHAGYAVALDLPPQTQLLGGRVCHLCGAPTAAFMARRDGKELTVFVPAVGSEAASEARRLAESSANCTQGPNAASICACTDPQPMFAVAQADPALVAASFHPVSK
ncbi:MAG TPA: hypothetical protein VHM70_11395 [Polyangiaceae bacterium]|jgi:anti-sigma factor RsiW|nr:hypothetical protein [Polyangiaceae bacterium]